MNRSWLVMFAFLGVFFAGAVTGGLVGVRATQSYSRNRASEQFAQQQLKRLADHLSLTSEQRQRIRPIMMAAGREVQDHRRQIFSISEKMEAEVRQILTDEQRGEYDRVRGRLRENEKVFQHWVREQRARRSDSIYQRDSKASGQDAREAPSDEAGIKP